MDATNDLTLESLIDLDNFRRIQSQLSNIVKFSLVTVNADGTPISALSNFSSFCQLIRSSEEGSKACIQCDKNALKRCLSKNHSIVYKCHCGLMDCAAPIIVGGTVVGGVLGGQVFIREEDRSKMDTELLAEKFHLDKKDLDRTVSEIVVATKDYLQLCLQFYGFFAEYIADKSYQTIIQQQLAKETMERIRQQQIASEQMLKRIQAQMNPHFLFNALNSIARTALIEDSPETEKLIYDLSNYLRYTVKSKTDTPTVADELDNLNHYLNIQKIRFGPRITYKIHVDENLKNCRIPSMTLQPLVENSIIHGLKNCVEDGQIEIDISEYTHDQKTDMMIRIHDNGCGIPKHIIDLIASNEDNDIKDTALGLGLTNPQSRIKTMYGPEYGIKIDSKLNEYTKLEILLPITY